MKRRSTGLGVNLAGLAVVGLGLWQPELLGKAFASFALAFALTASRLLEPLLVLHH